MTSLEPRTSASTLAAWRAETLTIILRVVAGVGFLAILGALPSGFAMQRYDLMAAVIGAYLVLLALTFLPRLGYTLRAGTLVLTFAALGVLHIHSYSLLGDGREYLFTSVILANLLFGPRISFAVLIFSVGAMGSLFAGFASGVFTLSAESLTRPTSGATLVSATLVFVLLTCLVGGSLYSLVKRLSASLAEAETARRQEGLAREEAQVQAATLAEQRATLERTENQLRALVDTLETPLVPLADGVVLAPIVGALDAGRMERITTRLLDLASRARARQVIVDIGGVASVDTEVARALTAAAEALRLLGCEVILTGVMPDVAATLTQLGVTLHSFQTARSPQEVLMRQRVGQPAAQGLHIARNGAPGHR